MGPRRPVPAPCAGVGRWYSEQDDGLAAAQYQLAEELLRLAGFEHYELSSWARPGFSSRHNAAYWERRPYTGIGAGAHSFDCASRSWNERDLDRYLARIEAGERAVVGSEQLDEPTRALEAVALGLRRVAGFSREGFAAEFGADPVNRFAQAVGDGIAADLLDVTEEAIRLTPRGRLFANEALVAFAP